ncbi:50S ribosomal protein L34e [Candidatus Woesearchaeota archaeon]|nr:50S ribosomal protein L34e [Candidatus Woesearchaeota archaeon]
MVQPRFRSRTHRRVSVRTPGGTTKRVFKKRKPQKAKCADCKVVLAGVPRERPYKMENMAKTKKRPERPYGGVLCSTCARKKIVSEADDLL